MLEFIREWTLQIAGVIIFSSICEMIIPSGTIKKYIHIVLGMILILTVISPIASSRIESGEGIFGNLEQYDAYASHINMEEVQREQVIKLYGDKLSEDIKSTLNQISGIDNAEVKAKIATEDIDTFGEIETLEIELTAYEKNVVEEVYKTIGDRYRVDRESIEIELNGQ